MIWYSIFLWFMLAFAFFLLFVIFSAFLGFLLTRVPFVPTYAGDVKFIVKKLGITSRDVFYDLGSGNGKVAFLVEKLAGSRVTGYELTWWTHLWAKLQKVFTGSKANFINRDFFKEDWSKANIIYCYLYPPLMRRIEEKFKTEMKPGSVAIVRDFPFPDMAYAEKYYLPKEHEIYVYKV